MSSAQLDSLEQRIAAFPWWYYRFEFDGGLATPVLSEASVNRAREMRRYLFEPLLALLGGSLRGRRVLDLGCNAGLWSLWAAEAGAEHVLGVDRLEMTIEQARLVFDAKRIEPARYRFEHADLFSMQLSERFDVVLCVDLLDQVAKPVELFELIARAQPQLVVIETSLTPERYSCFELCQLEDALTAVDDRMVLVPTREAVIDLAAQLGFSAVPLAPSFGEHTGLEGYRRGRRLGFICTSGEVSLDALVPAPVYRERAWWLRTLAGAVRRVGGRPRR